MNKFVDMQANFRFSKIAMTYKKSAINPEDGSTHFAVKREELHLHKAIGDLLLAGYKLSSFDDILSSTALSLRGIHLQAVGLYALLWRLCGYTLCSIETALLGHVTWKH